MAKFINISISLFFQFLSISCHISTLSVERPPSLAQPRSTWIKPERPWRDPGKIGFEIRDHSCITSAKRWVGGIRKWQFLLIYSTIYADVGGLVGLKKPKTC